MSKPNNSASLSSKLNQFDSDLQKLEQQMSLLSKQMDSINLPKSKPGIFNIKTVITENGEEQYDLQESQVVESPLVTRMNFLKLGDNFNPFGQIEKVTTPQKIVYNNIELKQDKTNSFKKKSLQRIHQSSPKKHPNIQVPFFHSNKVIKCSKRSENYVSTSESQIISADPTKYVIEGFDALLERNSTFQLGGNTPRTFPHFNLTTRKNSPSPSKRTIICLGRKLSANKY